MKETSRSSGGSGSGHGKLRSYMVRKPSPRGGGGSEAKAPVQCNQCMKLYDDEAVLEKHVRRVHIGPRWQCPECDYTAEYSDRPALRRHLQLDHRYGRDQALDTHFLPVRNLTQRSGAGGKHRSNGNGSNSSSSAAAAASNTWRTYGRRSSRSPSRASSSHPPPPDQGSGGSLEEELGDGASLPRLSPPHSPSPRGTQRKDEESGSRPSPPKSLPLAGTTSSKPEGGSVPENSPPASPVAGGSKKRHRLRTAKSASNKGSKARKAEISPVTSLPVPSLEEGLPGEGGLRVVWTGRVPPGVESTQLAIPQPIIERTYVREPEGGTTLVKEVFTFQPPQHWRTFLQPTLTVDSPSLSSPQATATSLESSPAGKVGNQEIPIIPASPQSPTHMETEDGKEQAVNGESGEETRVSDVKDSP